MKITKEDFTAYEAVRESGATNMFDVKTVMTLSGLEREQILEIMEGYDKYKVEFSILPKKTFIVEIWSKEDAEKQLAQMLKNEMDDGHIEGWTVEKPKA